MSSTRLCYDDCDIKSQQNENNSQLNYHIYKPKYDHHIVCRKKNLTCNMEDQTRTEIENDLLQLDNKSSKCSDKKYQPPCNNPTSCDVSNNNFTPMRILDREIAWTNIKKPTTNGLPTI